MTITTQSPDGLQAGDSVTISGFTGAAAGYNGTFVVTGAPTTTTFTYIPTTGSPLPTVTNPTGVSEVPIFNLFATDPQTSTGFTQGPTPFVNSLTINIEDQPPSDATNFPVYAALNITADENPGLYTVVGDQTGNVPISQVIVTDNPVVAGQPATATVQLIFAQPLLDDRYTLTINDNVVDPAGNQLDGTSNASDPGITNPGTRLPQRQQRPARQLRGPLHRRQPAAHRRLPQQPPSRRAAARSSSTSTATASGTRSTPSTPSTATRPLRSVSPPTRFSPATLPRPAKAAPASTSWGPTAR